MAKAARDPSTQNTDGLTWQVHLVRRQRDRLSTLAMILAIGATSVWLLFGQLLPVLVALCLLLGSAAEYLLPTRYTIDGDGLKARSLVSSLALSWREAKRCRDDASGMLVTPLPVASRLDRFRGVFLRYAPPGEPGDRVSVYEAIARYAPDLAPSEPPLNPLLLKEGEQIALSLLGKEEEQQDLSLPGKKGEQIALPLLKKEGAGGRSQ